MDIMRIGIVVWDPGEEIAAEASQSFSELGHDVFEFPAQAELPRNLDLIFAYGPFGSMVPLARQLIAIPEARRPAFIFWQIEPLPNPAQPKWLIKALGKLRSRIERLATRQVGKGEWQVLPGWRLLTSKAFRYRYCGDLLWLQEEGVLTLLVMGSHPNSDFLRELGLDSFQPPSPSFREGWGADLNLKRDVPVLWLGKSATRRRRRYLERVRRDLRALGIEMMVIDGIENPYIFGEARTRLLNRTSIVLNLLRNTWDSHAARFQLAAMNRALVVSEPCLEHTGFRAGEHFVVAPVGEIARTIQQYLENEEERRQIADRAYDLISKTPRKAIYATILEQVFEKSTEPLELSPPSNL